MTRIRKVKNPVDKTGKVLGPDLFESNVFPTEEEALASHSSNFQAALDKLPGRIQSEKSKA